VSPSDETRTSASAVVAGAEPRAWPEVSDHLAAALRDPSNRYRILGEHGRGGLGRVSRAHDVQLGRDVAIKELISHGHLSELRFLREALITARLEHPGIVPVHEAGRWPDGTPFYAMKLVAGRSLRDLLAERRSVDERIGLLHHVIAVTDAIAYAHGRNIIHRDLKPANVIVGDFGETVVIDWGLAKDLTADEEPGVDAGPFRTAHDDGLTSTGAVLGTPAYMPPEQQRGERVDQRADVYAIGAMLWELCAVGKLPSDGRAQRHRVLRRAGIDPDLATIIGKALDPAPERRYPDAGALAADLKAFKAGARIAARRYSPWGALWHWVRRHRALALTATTAILVAGVATAAYVRNIAAERDRADASQKAARATLDQLTLKHAELLLASDPSAALDALADYQGDDLDRTRQIRAEALGRGVAELRAAPHTDSIEWVEGTADGDVIAFGRDGRISRTSRDGRSRVIVDDVKKGRVYAYAASRHLLAYLCDPDDLCLLDITAGKRMHVAGSGYAPLALSFSPDDAQLALLSRTGDLWVFETKFPEQPVERAHLHPGPAGGVLFLHRDAIVLGRGAGILVVRLTGKVESFADPDGYLWDRGLEDRQLVISTIKGAIQLVDTDQLRITTEIQACRDLISGLRTIRRTATIAYSCKDGTVGIWDPRQTTVTVVAHLDGHAGRVEASPAGDYLVAAGDKGTLALIDLQTGITTLYQGQGFQLTAISSPTPAYPHPISADVRGGLRVWPPPKRVTRVLANVHHERVYSAAYDPQDKTVIAVTTGHLLFSYSAAGGLRKAAHSLTTPFLAIAADRAEFATYGSSSMVELWSLSPLTRRTVLDTGHGTVSHAEFVAGTGDLVTSGQDGEIVRWSSTGARHEIHHLEQPIDGFGLVPDASSLVVATRDGALWRVDKEDHLIALHPAGPRVTQLRVLPDGATVFVGLASGEVHVLDLNTGRLAHPVRAAEAIQDIAVAPNGAAVAVAANDGTIHLGARRGATWQAITWTTLAVRARKIAFTPDGFLVAITPDGVVWVYAPGLRAWACIPTSAADLTELVFDDAAITAFVFDVDGQLMSIDLEATRKLLRSEQDIRGAKQ
jgi:eukaryotic-like serine/threonine-protein kinase